MGRKSKENSWFRFILAVIFPALLAVLISVGSIYRVIIPAFTDSFMGAKREMLRELSNVAWSVMDMYHKEEIAGTLTREQAQRHALDEIEHLRYGNDGRDYFWINDMKPHLIMHPYSKELIGTDLGNFQTPEGNYLFREILATVEHRDSGFIDYLWNWKYTDEKIVPKLSFVKKFSPWNWVVGTGVFLDDVEIKTREITGSLSVMTFSAVGLITLLLMVVTFHSLNIERRRRAAEENLAESEEKYRVLVEAAVEPIMMVFEELVIYANGSMEQLLGYKTFELEGVSLAELVGHDLDAQGGKNGVTDILAEAMGRDPDGSYECNLKTKDGNVLLVHAAITEKTFGRQNVLVISVRDVRAAKRVERQLLESRENFRQIISDLEIGVFKVDADGQLKILEANNTIALLAGVNNEEALLKRNLLDIIETPRGGASLTELLQSDKRVRGKNYIVKSSEGKSTPVSLSMVPVTDENDGLLHYEGFMLDISAQEKREEERERFIVELQTSMLFLNQPIRTILTSYIHCDLHTTVHDAARVMSRSVHNNILVSSESGQMIGIITDSILRERILARNLSAETQVYEIMSSPLTYIEDSALIYEALLKLQERGGHHLVVRESSGEIVGVVTNEQLLNVHQYSSSFMLSEIKKAESVEDLQTSQARMPRMVKALSDSGSHAGNISKMITNISDSIFVKIIDMTIKELGAAPVSFAFISLGSEGRGEQTLATDQDNAIIYADVEMQQEDEEHVKKYFLQLGNKVCTRLDQVGYRFCKGEVMAMNQRWCQPLSIWKTYFREWIAESSPEDLMEVSIFFDFRCIYGEDRFTEELREYVQLKTAQQMPFFIQLAQNCLDFKIPVDFFGKLSVESGGEHPDTFNMKHALAVIIGFARIQAIYHGLKPTGTLQRLAGLLEMKGISNSLHDEIVETYDFLMRLRFKHQVLCVDEGKEPDNHIPLSHLTHMEREMLEKVFGQLGDLRKKLSQLGKSELFF